MGPWNKTARARKGDPLTPRELEVLALLAAGNTTPEIARRLGVADGTIKTHLGAVYKKIDAKNRIQATLYFLDHHAPSDDAPDAA